MTPKRTKQLKIGGALLLAYAVLCYIPSCGSVIDQTTGKPIAGAVVMAYWQGHVSSIVQGHSLCTNVEVTTTDESGRFWIPIFSGNLNPFITDRYRPVEVIAHGYEQTSKSRELDLIFMMAPRQGTRSEQFEDADRHYRAAGCYTWNKKKILPYLKAWHKELDALASTPTQRTRANYLLNDFESIEYGEEVASARRAKRIQATQKSEVEK